MAKYTISPIYRAIQKMGGKRPEIGRPSDEPKQIRKSDVIAQEDVYTKDGMLRAAKIHKNEYGTYVCVGGHEIKVINTHNVWHQKGTALHDLPMKYHAREIASIDPTPVKIYSDFTRLARPTQYKDSNGNLVNIFPSKQKGLKGETRDLTPQRSLRDVTPTLQRGALYPANPTRTDWHSLEEMRNSIASFANPIGDEVMKTLGK